MIYINDKIAEIGEKELDELISGLPEWRRLQALRFKHLQGRKECALSYRLLCEALEGMGHSVQPTFVYEKYGKPSLVELPMIHFNLSHCRAAVACAVDSVPVGVDVEMLGRYNEQLAQYTMNTEEQQEIAQSENPDETFTRLWTMKEATMKLIGEGISTNVRAILATHSSNIIYRTELNRERQYVVTVAKWRS